MNAELAAVLADPEAEAPRRAVAAMLERAGDPRGRFITIQLEASAERRAAGESAEYRALNATAQAMLARNQAAWTRELAGLAIEPRFHRGFIEGVTMDARQFLARGAELYKIAPIRHLTLNGARPVIGELAASPLLRRLASLGVNSNDLGDVGAAAIAGSTQLERLRLLDLSFNGITRTGLDALAASPNLARIDYINLAGNPCGEPGETYGVDPMTLTIVGGSIGSSPLGAELEARHGERPWLHAPSRLLSFPPGEADV